MDCCSQQARYDSLVAAIDAPGVSALGLIANLQSFTPSAQTEREVAKQTNSLTSAGAKGRAVLHDIDVYLQGINAYLVAHGGAGNFTRTDIYAFNALKDQFVGEGGGDEAVRSEFLGALDRKFGRVRGVKIWNDLRGCVRPGGARQRARTRAAPAAPAERERERGPRSKQPDAGGRQALTVARDARRPCQQRIARVRAALGDPSPDHGRRTADWLLLPDSAAGRQRRHIAMDKDLRTMLGERVQGKLVRYCGAGNLKRCRAQLGTRSTRLAPPGGQQGHNQRLAQRRYA